MKNMLIKKLVTMTMIMAFMLILAGCENFIESNNNDDKPGGQTLEFRSSAYFDSFVQINIYYSGVDRRDEINAAIHDILSLVHQNATHFDEYDNVTNVRTINENPGIPHEVDAVLFDMIRLSVDYYEESNGYFDITLGPVINIWDEYREICLDWEVSLRGAEDAYERYHAEKDTYCQVPSTAELEAANQNTGIERITLDEENQTVMIEAGMHLDLGGIGKGYGAKMVGDYLKSLDYVDSFLLNAGTSNVEVYGDHPLRENKLWYTGLVNPENQGRTYGSIKMSSGDNATTSGDYQRYYEVDGRIYHHLIDPNTLFPTDHHRSVTLVSADGSIGDILVTAIFLMSLEDGMDYVNDRDGLEAIWFVSSDERPLMSDNFESLYLRQLDPMFPENDAEDASGSLGLILTFVIPATAILSFGVFSFFRQKHRNKTG